MKKHTRTLLLVSLMALTLIFTSVPGPVWAEDLLADGSQEVLDSPENLNEINDPGNSPALDPDAPPEPAPNEPDQTPDALELPVPEEEPDDSQDEGTVPENDPENIADLQMVEAEPVEKAYVLTNDVTGEVVGSWNEGEENVSLTACHLPDEQPCTLTLYRDLTTASHFYLQNGITLTVQSADNRNCTIHIGKTFPDTTVDEEIFDVDEGSTLILKNLVLDGLSNDKVSRSRGIYLHPNVKLIATNCAFRNFGPPSDKVKQGMAIHAMQAKSVQVSNCIFENNISNNPAGAAYLKQVSDSCTFDHVTFINNQGTSAGAVKIEGTKAILDNCVFESNKTTSTTKGQGGAIYISEDSEVTIAGSDFTNNTATDGGAICIFPNNKLTKIEKTSFKNNTATGNSGGAILVGSQLEITDSDFSDNTAANYGGAIYLVKNIGADIKGATKFMNNSCGSEGGAIYDAQRDYKDPANAETGYRNLTTDGSVSFEGNSAPYLYNPPSNFGEFNWIQFARTSFTGKLNPNNGQPILKNDFPLNNFDINYMNAPDGPFKVTFEFKSRDSEKTLPDEIIQSCPKAMEFPLNALIVPPLVPELKFDQVVELDGQRWTFDIWEPASKEVTKDGIHFIGYWTLEEDFRVAVSKVWDDADNQDGKRPDFITIQLLADGEDTGKQLILSEANNWAGVFTDLSARKDGAYIVYTVAELPVGDAYTATITGDAKQGFVVTNSLKPEEPVPALPSLPQIPSVTVSSPIVFKKISGGQPANADLFTFSIAPISYKPDPLYGGAKLANLPLPQNAQGAVKEVQIFGEGTASAGMLTYRQPGYYEYEIREIPSATANYLFSKDVYTFIDHVYEHDGDLIADRTMLKNGQKANTTTAYFINQYLGEGGSPTMPKDTVQSLPATGYQDSLPMGCLLLGVGLAALLRKKHLG